MTATLIALAAALAPGNIVMIVAQRDLARARDRWLLATLGVGSVWLAFHGALWLALLGLWYVCAWREETQRSSLIVWAGIGASWFLLRSMPDSAWTYLPWAWLLLACAQVVACVWMAWKTEFPKDNRRRLGWRTKGTLGSPVITGIFLAVTFPFAPFWLWPVYAVGVWLTFSFTTFVGIALGAAWLFPGSAIYSAGVLALLLWTMWQSKRHSGDVVGTATFASQRLLEATPRGDSVDGWWGRLLADQLLIAEWWAGGRRWLGQGPGSAGKAVQQWNSMQARELPNGEAHCDGLQLLYEYGLLGLGAALAFAGGVVPHLALGDAWSAAWIVTIAISLIHWPLRHPAIAMLFLAVSARLA